MKTTITAATYYGTRALLERDFANDPDKLRTALERLDAQYGHVAPGRDVLIEEEAYQEVRERLIAAAMDTGHKARLPGWLDILARIHVEAVAEASARDTTTEVTDLLTKGS